MNSFIKKYQTAGSVTPRMYDNAMIEYQWYMENPESWKEDPEMHTPDGKFNLCLDCIKVDWSNPEDIKDAYRLIEEGYSIGTHHNKDAFVNGYKALGLPDPVYNKFKLQSGDTSLQNKKAGGQMIKRADGSYSQRGFWDNIRDNVGSGKKPTKEMLEQERKIKAMNFGGISQMRMGGTQPCYECGGVYAKGGVTNCPPGMIPDGIGNCMYDEEITLWKVPDGSGGFTDDLTTPPVPNSSYYKYYQDQLNKFVGNPQQETIARKMLQTKRQCQGDECWDTVPEEITKVTDNKSSDMYYLQHSPEGGNAGVAYLYHYDPSQKNSQKHVLGAVLADEWLQGDQLDNFMKTGEQQRVEFDPNKRYFTNPSEPHRILEERWKVPAQQKADARRKAAQEEAERLKQTMYRKEEGGIYLDPAKKGTFKAQATRMGMSVQEAASHIMANKEDFSPEMIKKAVFAHNFANQFGGIVDENDKYRNGGDIQLPKAVAGAIIPLLTSALGAGAGAGAAAGAAGSAGAGSALAGAAAKGMGSKMLSQAAGKGMGQIKGMMSSAANSPDITSYNLANASMLSDDGYLSGLKAMVGLGTALSNVAGTFTQPFAGASPFAKFAGKSNLQTPMPPVGTQKMGAPQKQTIPDYSDIYTESSKNYSTFMPQLTFQQGMPLKTQVGPVAEFNNGGSLPRFQGVDEFGNFTTSIVNPGMTGINLGQSLYNNSAVGQQANTLGTQLPQVQSAIQNGYDPAKNLYQNSEVGQQSQQLKQENPFASGLNKVGSEQSEAPAGLPPGFGSMTGPGMNRTMGFISGMNMFNTVLEARQNKKARKKWERENMNNSDSVINPTVVESPFGLYDPNTGVLKPANKVATQDFGTTGVARQGGQKMYREGGTYMLDKNEIMRILAAGGEIEFI